MFVLTVIRSQLFVPSHRSCNVCEDNSDCNLNGKCNEDGECECNESENEIYLGTHCEVKLKDSCRNITSSGGSAEALGDKIVWSVDAAASESLVGKVGVFEEYRYGVLSLVVFLASNVISHLPLFILLLIVARSTTT